MAERLSLLHKEEIPVGTVGEETLYRLSIDKILAYFCRDVRDSAAFAETICHLPCTVDGVLYRRAILQDLLEHSALLQTLYEHFEKLSRYHEEYERERREIYRTQRAGGQGQSFAGAGSLLSVSALTLKRLLLLLGALDDLLGCCSFSSEGLRNLQADIRRIAGSEDTHGLLALCTKFERYTTVGQLDFRLVLTASGRIGACDLIPHNAIHADFLPKKKKSFFKKQEEKRHTGVVLDPVGVKLQEEMYVSSVVRLAAQFGEIARFLFDKYKHLRRELLFYKAALQYCYRLQNLGVATCFPTVAAGGCFSCESAYDLLLLLTTSPAAVVPYSVTIDGDAGGTILFGDNSSGKTTFLRTVGVLQILAQAGLPVPAEQMTFSPCSLLLSYYAEAEKAEQGAGRFEQEVREFRAMFDLLVPGALVLLNEPFQSTSYDEGAKGLSDILKYFSASGICWILVSHMHQLKKHVRRDVQLLQTAAGYKIRKAACEAKK